jgi:hypothetical protein
MRVEGLPRDIQSEEEHNVLPGDINHGVQVFDGEGLEVDGRLITTLYGTFDGDPGYSTICFESDDEGRTWRYLSVVAGPDILPDRGHGPGEANMCVLETGELMCVMRLGGGREFNLARPIAATEAEAGRRSTGCRRSASSHRSGGCRMAC